MVPFPIRSAAVKIIEMIENNFYLFFGLILFIVGLVYTFFNKKIIQLQGKSNKGDFTEKERKGRLIIIGIAAIIVGILIILRSL